MKINAFSRLSVKARNSYDRFILWRKANISQKNFTVLLALIVGVLTALAAVLLKHVIHFIANLLTGTIHSADDGWLLMRFSNSELNTNFSIVDNTDGELPKMDQNPTLRDGVTD